MSDSRTTWDKLRPPRPPHGRRLLISQIDIIGREDADRPWISVPVDDLDLSQGYKDISFRQFANAVNIAAHWLRENLGLPSGEFAAFAYAGPPDYRYGLFAMAAAKLGYQIIPFGRSIGSASQQKIMDQKTCSVYLHTSDLESVANEVQNIDSRVRKVCAPELKDLMINVPAEPINYRKSWEDAKDDPWLVFHTSGTTGFPKVVTYSQQMLSTADIVMGLEDDIGDTTLEQYVNSRCYLPMPPAHYVSMFMTLGASVWVRAVPVFGPGGLIPSPSVVKGILKHGRVDGAMLVPALIDALCQDPESLDLLRELSYIQYAGAPLSAHSGKLLSSVVRVVPAIGSTDAGGYFVRLPNKIEDWDYVSLQPHTGAVMEHRVDNLYELVFVRHPRCAVQPVFESKPDLERFETKDLWMEHRVKKGQWKLVGRSDDLIKLANGAGLIVTPIEVLITEHPFIKHALIGGHGRPKALVLIELTAAKAGEVSTREARAAFIEILRPHIDKVNLQVHDLAKLDTQLIIFARPDKPWPLTIKDTPIRSQVIKLYQPEIEDAYTSVA